MSTPAQFYFPSSPPAPPVATPVPPPSTLRRVSGGFGAGPFGAMPFGSGGGVAIASAMQIARNAISMRISGPVRAFNPADVSDALYDRGYTLAVYNVPLGAPEPHVPRVVFVERVSADTITLYTDSTLDGPGVVYRLIGSPAVFGDGDESARSVLFRTFGDSALVRTERARSRSFDLANVQAGPGQPGEQQPLGTLVTDADGDYQNDAGLENLKKRVIRRVTTRKGAYVHAPEYGLRVPLKGLVTPAVLRDLQQQALAQVGQEPGVTACSVTATEPSPGIVLLGVEVEAQGQSFGVDVELPLGAAE
jgi:hypothetical protein